MREDISKSSTRHLQYKLLAAIAYRSNRRRMLQIFRLRMLVFQQGWQLYHWSLRSPPSIKVVDTLHNPLPEFEGNASNNSYFEAVL